MNDDGLIEDTLISRPLSPLHAALVAQDACPQCLGWLNPEWVCTVCGFEAAATDVE